MAINPVDIPCEKISTKSQGSSNGYKHGHSPTSRLVKIDFSTEGSVCSLTFKHGKFKKNSEIKSPYLSGDNIHMLSRVTERRYVHKKGPNMTNIVSSFPLAATIYKANSDEFKVAKKTKKVQKSVLTLPNDPAPLPGSCTVSDMNDSEYFKRDDSRKKGKKMRPAAANHTRKSRGRGKHFEFYDRDAAYCSQLHLDCSSAETVTNYNGDGKRKSKAIVAGSKSNVAENTNKPHDVWAVLRNINRFQFTPSPPMSEDSFITPRKRKSPRRRNNRKDMRVFGTCCTEEIAYISRYEIDKASRCNLSHSSSIDKITVIDQQHDFDSLCTKLEERMLKKKKEKVRSKGSKKKMTKNKSQPPKSKANYDTMAHSNQKRKKTDSTCDDSSGICPNYKELKKIIASNMTLDQDREIEIIQDEDNLSVDSSFTRQNSQCSEFILCSEHSGSSKAAYKQKKNTKNKTKSGIQQNEQKIDDDVVYFDLDKFDQFDDVALSDLEKSDPQINGITRVVLSKALNEIQSILAESPKCETTPVPNRRHYVPKLTRTSIRRQLNKCNFPIVVLNKDQLSSSVKVINQEHPQFNGLDEHIWPFMRSWQEVKRPDKKLNAQSKTFNFNALKKKGENEEVDKKVPKNNSGFKQPKLVDKKPKKDCKPSPVVLPEYLGKPLNQIKSKPMRQFRDRMIKLLCKNSSSLNESDKCSNVATKQSTILKFDSCSDMQDSLSIKEVTPTIVETKKPKPSPPTEKRPWAKAKWASDFIENVIRKIKSGAYYTHDNVFRKVAKEPEQTVAVVTCDVPTQESKNVPIQETTSSPIQDSLKELPIKIPGFDDALPPVEIKTMNMNEISVKHCVTNIMVYFDVNIPLNAAVRVENSSELIPIDITPSKTRIFKCQTSILNAMLPAELCSILPKMMHNIAKLGQQLQYPPVLLDKTSSELSTISEVTRCESPIDVITPLRRMLHTPMAKELWRLLNGRYLNSDKMLPKSHNPVKILLVRYESRFVKGLTPKIAAVQLFSLKEMSTMPMMIKVQENKSPPTITPVEPMNSCTALEPYTVAENVVKYHPFNLTIMFESTTNSMNNIGVSCYKIVNTITTISNTTMRYFLKIPDIVTLSLGHFKTDSFCNGYLNIPSSINRISIYANAANEINNSSINCIENVGCSSYSSTKRNTSLQRCVVPVNNKLRKKGFVKLYRKYKYPPSVSCEKVTQLSKIENLDDFSRALGSGKILSSVFDNQSGHKIMSSIQEMKNWTTEINSKQALLVVLLTNKKNTPNLLRYRPVLLQGIALKRITKANELDMEIEVIERENLNGLSRFEGITYLPASVENQDNLFEELCWIAKTTASDYQKPFDESSEKLLKSLLEKRKKLNPSYLRVMARYVGLGLLKSSSKK